MKIALIGYGKMGHAIETIAIQRKHTIVLKISIENTEENTVENISKADVAIEFTGPDSAFDNINKCFEAGVPVVSGSTGWLQRYEEAAWNCKAQNGALLYASNFSIGVNIFFEVNKKLAQLMASQTDYNVTVEETHHTQKKDAPSGTAITIAEQILAVNPFKKQWINTHSEKISDLEIISKRIDPTPGTHKVLYQSETDDIEIIHTAHNRTGFALGAVLAAEFLYGRRGVFGMSDVLGL
ncbi:MAG: 4-hydroxy-tetrahydrodipicolinate reductase [Chitinophagaceae bacterium]|nr:4-hydroxy-tetrahydrodipicolinate reductase [Chitinophagaceae bacterium]